MLESMTGYGRGEHIGKHVRAIAEIRSVNFRYCEISLKLPSQFHSFEQALKDAVHKRVKRGKISLTVEISHHVSDDEPLHLQVNAIKKRIRTLEQIRTLAGIEDPLKLDHLLVFEDLFELTENNPDLLREQYDTVEKAVMQSVDALLEMRRNEGRNLQEDMEKRLLTIQEYCAAVSGTEKDRILEAKKKLEDRLSLLLDDNKVDHERIEQEIALMADRLDISEELVRMDSHISYFNECLQQSDLQGKKLNFILQEMHREVNTIGSKANSSSISRMVVEMKEAVENIREQIQNIA